jgi:hypothetical protein
MSANEEDERTMAEIYAIHAEYEREWERQNRVLPGHGCWWALALIVAAVVWLVTR